MNEGPLYLIFIMLIRMMAFLLSNSIQLNFNFFWKWMWQRLISITNSQEKIIPSKCASLCGPIMMESSQTYFFLLSDSLFKKISVEETSVSFLVKYLKVRQT